MASTFMIRCRASDDLSLAIVDGEAVLTKADARDDRQLWLKDMRYGAGLTDEAGSPAFALVNKATGEALKHSFGHSCPVRAIKFYPAGYVDESVLWAESEEHLGDGFRRIHMINNMDYIFDAEQAIPDYGGARDGTRLILFRWNGGQNQQWRIAPRSAPAAPGPELPPPDHARPVQILCRSGQGLSLTVRDGAAVLARADREDQRQCWVQSFRNTGHVTDDEGHRAFALVNRATGKALGHCRGDELVYLVGHKPDSVGVALLWTQSDDVGEEYHNIRTVSDVGLVLDAASGVPEAGGAHDGTAIIVFPRHGGCNQKWKMLPFY
ncbi:ricin B-like lectin R40C1 [Setaria viridis]|uniref:Ricin B lectin domain-containing protein n=1 Tax=Setaria viridis TaxID=4556 RepID=A0A4U6TGF0_SETVI|nr:ricin B-like lectin R40G2 [Setaria viridis]TKV96346.1 hypothetical protein SEVIR_9G422500v2 [Setaria viridis]